MTILVDALRHVAGEFDAFVLDQWGVLHNGAVPYPGARAAAARLVGKCGKVLVLSNSGKRADLNAARMARLGFDQTCYSHLLTSGEALWTDLNDGKIVRERRGARSCYVIARAPEDVGEWFSGMSGSQATADIDKADLALLLGIRDGSVPGEYDALLGKLLDRGLKLLCANPDQVAPGPQGLHLSPGSVALRYEKMGGSVTYYGKPHALVFEHAKRLLVVSDSSRMLVVGDTLGTDIAGGAAAGMATMLVRGGVLAKEFADCPAPEVIGAKIAELAARHGTPAPDYSMDLLSY